jgi:hypothetical protein
MPKNIRKLNRHGASKRVICTRIFHWNRDILSKFHRIATKCVALHSSSCEQPDCISRCLEIRRIGEIPKPAVCRRLVGGLFGFPWFEKTRILMRQSNRNVSYRRYCNYLQNKTNFIAFGEKLYFLFLKPIFEKSVLKFELNFRTVWVRIFFSNVL